MTNVYPLKDLSLYFLKLGSLGFGGPVALVCYMQRDLVENRKWFNEDDYGEGLALSQLAPGPLAAQLAIYLSFGDYGVLGATAAGLAAIGAIAGAVVMRAKRTLNDLPTILIAVATAAILWRFKKLQEPYIIAAAAVLGIILKSIL